MLSLNEIYRRMENLTGWSIDGGVLIRDFEFKSFDEAILFVNKIAAVAKDENHHPSIYIDYNHVRVSLTTHEIRGISEKDFSFAEKLQKDLSSH